MTVADPERLVKNEYFVLERLSDHVLEVTRTARPFESEAVAASCCSPVVQALDAIGRSGSALMIDTRPAVPNNDPEYERWYAPCRKNIT